MKSIATFLFVAVSAEATDSPQSAVNTYEGMFHSKNVSLSIDQWIGQDHGEFLQHEFLVHVILNLVPAIMDSPEPTTINNQSNVNTGRSQPWHRKSVYHCKSVLCSFWCSWDVFQIVLRPREMKMQSAVSLVRSSEHWERKKCNNNFVYCSLEPANALTFIRNEINMSATVTGNRTDDTHWNTFLFLLRMASSSRKCCYPRYGTSVTSHSWLLFVQLSQVRNESVILR